MPEPLFADDRPLFIVGCVRSGTTLTRDLLRRVPNFICPEETHFFRWAEPFRTPGSWGPYSVNALLKKHREIDGVPQEVFDPILQAAGTRADLQRRYITALAAAQGIEGPYRWFDKTPQNVYGAALIAQEFPQARFLHLVRNPLNVVASLQLGRQVKVPDLRGACNYWCEAVNIMATMTRAYPERILTLRYEDLVTDVAGNMERILAHAGITSADCKYTGSDAHPERNLWQEALDREAVEHVVETCGPLAAKHGYDLARYLEPAAR